MDEKKIEIDVNVEIPFDSVRWNILTEPKEVEDGVDILLSWGWTAGMTEEDFENYAEDAPIGSDCVTTTLDGAIELRDKLTALIEQYQQRHEQLRAENDRRFNEKYPNWNETIADLVQKRNETKNEELE